MKSLGKFLNKQYFTVIIFKLVYNKFTDKAESCRGKI